MKTFAFGTCRNIVSETKWFNLTRKQKWFTIMMLQKKT